MNPTGNVHRNDLNLLKGFSILAIVLYHMGISRSGYLGVDAFLVVNGFLVVPKVVSGIDEGTFRLLPFLEKRAMRLLPLMLLASLLSLLVGFWGMLPDDYENLGESVVATNFFSSNILAWVTINNYWDVSNDFKPLMHTWYIGILFEFYLVFPLIVMLVKRLSERLRFGFEKYAVITILALSVISLLLYLNPSVGTGDKFYLLPFRFYEMAFGGLAGMWIASAQRKGRLLAGGLLSGTGFLVLLLTMFAGIFYVGETETEYCLVSGAADKGESFIPQNILLLLTVVLTLLFVVSDNTKSRLAAMLVRTKVICLTGMMSYSIFIWHQPILAFYRYFVSTDMAPSVVAMSFAAVLAVAYITYRFVEQKITAGTRTRTATLLAFVVITGAAFALYLHAGVVRDVPELDIQMNHVHRNMHSDYVDRIYQYDTDFPAGKEGTRTNVLVAGNSFARDWGNILLESEMAERINLSYISDFDEKYAKRIRQADYIFVFGWKHNVPSYVWENIRPDAEAWGIGTKTFGLSNGVIYKNRLRHDYFQQTIKINPIFIETNKQLKKDWNGKYIDLLEMSLAREGRVIVFTEEHKLISQDTRHLTKSGAAFFARKIDFGKIFQE